MGLIQSNHHLLKEPSFQSSCPKNKSKCNLLRFALCLCSYPKVRFRVSGSPFTSGRLPRCLSRSRLCPAQEHFLSQPGPCLRANLRDGEQTQRCALPPATPEEGAVRPLAPHTRNAWELPLFPFSSTAAKSTPFSKRTEQMVGRSCWAAWWRAVWAVLG